MKLHLAQLCAASVLMACSFRAPSSAAEDEPGPLKVCATVPDLGDLARELGGDQVDVTVFVKGVQDPHFMEPKPSFIRALSEADLFLEVGMDLEVGWVPRLQQGARNARVLIGGEGFLDASRAIVPLEPLAGVVDRSLGDVHPLGNPHYLLDPVNGWRVARAIRDRLCNLRLTKAAYFNDRYRDLVRRLGSSLLGEKLTAKYDPDKLIELYDRGGLEAFLRQQGDDGLLGGWLRRMAALRGSKVVADHNLWPYFARRYGIEVVGFLEPKPGIAPTTRHLNDLVVRMKSEDVRAILAVPYFDPRHVRFVAEKGGVPVAELAHQCGARPDTDRYLMLCEYNVAQMEKALGGKK